MNVTEAALRMGKKGKECARKRKQQNETTKQTE